MNEFPQTVLLAPVGKSGPRDVAQAVVERLRRHGTTVLVDVSSSTGLSAAAWLLQDPDVPSVEAMLRLEEALELLADPHARLPRLIAGWRGSRYDRPQQQAHLQVAADLTTVVHLLRDRGAAVVILGPSTLQAGSLYAAFGVPLCDRLLLISTYGQLGQWATDTATLLRQDEGCTGPAITAVLFGDVSDVWRPSESLDGLLSVLGDRVEVPDSVASTADPLAAAYVGLHRLLGLPESVQDREKRHQAETRMAEADLAALRPALDDLGRRLGLDVDWHFDEVSARDVSAVEELADLLQEAHEVVRAHEEAFRRHDLYLGDFWYDALLLTSKAAPELAALKPHRVRCLLATLVELLDLTDNKPLDVTKRATEALGALLHAAADSGLSRLSLAYAGCVSLACRGMVARLINQT